MSIESYSLFKTFFNLFLYFSTSVYSLSFIFSHLAIHYLRAGVSALAIVSVQL